MTRTAQLASALLVAGLLLTGCGGADEPTTAEESTSTEEPTAEESTPEAGPSESEDPAASPSTATGPVAEFDLTALCPSDRALSENVTGSPLTTDKVFKAGESLNGAPVQGDTCLLEGPQGQVETVVITEPALVDRRKSLDFATIAPCETAPLDGGWDKAWTCDLPDGHGPVLVRNGTDSVFTCIAMSKGPKPAAASSGRAACDAVLAAVGG